MVGPNGLEPSTSSVSRKRSNQLSYGPAAYSDSNKKLAAEPKVRTAMKMRIDVRSQAFVVAVFFALCLTANATERKYISNPRPGGLNALPFSDGVLVGDTLYIAGHIGLDAKSGQPPVSAEDEARAVLDGIKKTVESAGLAMDDVVSVQVFCTDLKLYDTFNAVYKTYFLKDYPARAFIGTDKLLRGARYEVMGIAVKKRY